MKVKVLGCYGGPGIGKRTTAFLLNDNTLLDGGTIVSALEPEKMKGIKRIFLSHAHLDHIKEIPFFISAAAAWSNLPIEIYAIEPVIQALKDHLFNGTIWPDFEKVPEDRPLLKYVIVEPEKPFVVDDLSVTFVLVNHTVPCAGMLIEKNGQTLVYTADTFSTDRLWEVAAGREIAVVIAEVSFPPDFSAMAQTTLHFTADLLVDDLKKIGRSVPVLVFHFKPEVEELIRSRLDVLNVQLQICNQDEVYTF